MSIKLIAFDLDGTFLDDSKNIPEENIRALKEAAARGIYIVPATGRLALGVPEPIRSLPFMRYYLTVNGAYIYDACEDRIIRRAELSAEAAVEIMEYLNTLPVIYDCYKDNWGFMTRSMYDCAGEYITNPGIMKLVRELRTPVDSLYEMTRSLGEPLQKLQLYTKDPQQNKAALMAELKRRFPGASITSSLPFNIEINDARAGKGKALLGLCEYLGIDPADTMAFGDGSNDTEMIAAAGIGVAMANAEEDVKAAADYITDSNNDAGVAKAIWKFAL